MFSLTVSEQSLIYIWPIFLLDKVSEYKWFQSEINTDNIWALQPEIPTSGFVFVATKHSVNY